MLFRSELAQRTLSVVPTTATIVSATIDRGLRVGDGGAASFDTLLGTEEAHVEIARGDWRFATMDNLYEGVIFFIKSVEDVGGEILIPERLPDGGEGVRERLHLTEEGRGRFIELLHLRQLGLYLHRSGGGLRAEAVAESSPFFLSGSDEEDQTRQGQRCCEMIADMIAWTDS